MSLEQDLKEIIETESNKLIKRYHAYHNRLHEEHIRSKKRLKDPKLKVVKKPKYWELDKKFNPFYVRRKAGSISRAMAKSLKSGVYSPREPYINKVEKPGGGYREVSIYQIPDAAVSKYFYNRLLAKNKHRFSSFSYAYRNDRNVHFAIQDIYLGLSQSPRTFVSEFDFSDFFGSIGHEYLRKQFDENGFYISKDERRVIESFLGNKGVGIPQGTSISLFLANLVCWQLDRELENEGLRFARYADDTVVWSPSYGKICNSFEIINRFSESAGVNINLKKSDGISLLSKHGMPEELSSAKSYIEFLGYRISPDRLSIKDSSVINVKKHISYLIYKNLIQPLKGSRLRGRRVPSSGEDKDLLIAIMQVRRYMYGGVSDQIVRDYINGRINKISFKGVMSFYPLVDDVEQLYELDGWLVSTLYRAVKLRQKLFLKWNMNVSGTFPFNLSKKEFVQACKVNKTRSKKVSYEIPSFMLIQKALEKGLVDVGIEDVMNPMSNKYSYY